MKDDQAQELFRKLKNNVLTAGETQLLEQWLLQYRADEPSNLGDEELQTSQAKVWDKISKEKNTARISTPLWPRIAAAAASVIFVLSLAGYFYLKSQQQVTQQNAKTVSDIKPGSNGAILTLANGQKIVLEQTQTGAIAQQNGSNLQKAGDSLLVYKATAAGDNEPTYNILETPKGRQYAVVLPDGTKVWLNAGSSLKYPTAFVGARRLVVLTGEAYFEVVHNSKQPFCVQALGQSVDDIGTSFNVNAYSDEAVVKTTLLEGVVKVNGLILKPGQQSDGKTVQSVDTEETIAWKNGSFQFDNADIKTVIRQLTRWYDVDIRCEGNVADIHYTGLVPRRSNISAVLKMLNETGGTVYKINGRTITITK